MFNALSTSWHRKWEQRWRRGVFASEGISVSQQLRRGRWTRYVSDMKCACFVAGDGLDKLTRRPSQGQGSTKKRTVFGKQRGNGRVG